MTWSVSLRRSKLVEQRDGWMVLLDDAEGLTDHDLAEHRVAVEQAVTIVGTEPFASAASSVPRSAPAATSCTRCCTHASPTTPTWWRERAHYSFDVAGRYAVVVAQSGGLIARGDSPAKLADMARDAGRLLESPQRQTLTAVVGDVIAVVRQVSSARRGQTDPAVGEMREYATVLDRRLRDRSQRDVAVAYGRPVEGAAGIVESYPEARIALELRQRLRVTEVCGFADLRVDSVLLDLAQREEGLEFSREILASRCGPSATAARRRVANRTLRRK